MTPMKQIVLNLAEFRALVGGKTLSYRIAGERVELVIASIPWTQLFRAVLDGIQHEPPPPGAAPPDPPEAREFLRRNHRK
jgi:hypothetical protein